MSALRVLKKKPIDFEIVEYERMDVVTELIHHLFSAHLSNINNKKKIHKRCIILRFFTYIKANMVDTWLMMHINQSVLVYF